MRRELICLISVILLSCCTASAQPDSVAQAVSSLEKQALVFRDYYTDEKLVFESDGHLVGKGTPGFGPADGRIYVEKVKLDSKKLSLQGRRTVPVYDKHIHSYWLATIDEKVKVDVNLPSGVTREQLVSLLKKIFMQQSELDALKCKGGADYGADLAEGARHDPATNLPDVESLQELTPLCSSNGEKAYRVGAGVLAPKVLYAPDPTYTSQARSANLQGTVVLSLIVDPDGRPSTMSVVTPLGNGLDEKAVEAVQRWKFQPATFHGTPVPVFINVEVNFRLY